jgi:signal transduction histidine kinase
MPLSLRTRLTLWYSALLFVGMALFTATVLWLHWRLVLRESDRSLERLCVMAANAVVEELGEGSTPLHAAGEVEAMVRNPEYAVAVLDSAGSPIHSASLRDGLVPASIATLPQSTFTIEDRGRAWRMTSKRVAWNGDTFTVAIAAPMTPLVDQWNALLKACALGIPLVLVVAIGGGWILGRRGLQPLADMAVQAHAITDRTPERRLAVPEAAPELAAVAVSFNRVLDRLGRGIATQRRFMADASHELRTPLSIIRTAADVTLAQPKRDDSEYRDALGAVSQQSARLARLVDDMLVLARGDAGGYPIARSELDLDAVVGDCLRELASRAQAKSIRVTSALQPVCVVADEGLIRRMLVNLLANALSYTPDGGAVHVAMVVQPGAVRIDVADSGPGIAEQDRARIFERFVRLDPARGEGGVGLGLSIARWIAEAHGGQVELRSSGPQGSVFAAILPITA